MCENRIDHRRTPTERAASTKSLSLCARMEPRKAAQDRDLGDADGDHHLREPGAEHGRDADRQEQAGDRERHVHYPHQDRVDDAAEEPRDPADHQADREADADGDEADQQRVARSVHDAAELVAPQTVEAEPVVARRVLRPEQPVVQALRERIIGAMSGAKSRRRSVPR